MPVMDPNQLPYFVPGEYWVGIGLVFFWVGIVVFVREAIIAPSGRNGRPVRKGRLWLPLLVFAWSGVCFGYAIGSLWWIIGFVIGSAIFTLIMLVAASDTSRGSPTGVTRHWSESNTSSTYRNSGGFGGFGGGRSGGGGAGRSW